jgi:hypothetical protein
MKFFRLFVLLIVLTLSLGVVFAVQPFGVEQNGLVKVNSTRAPMDIAGNHTAIAGNVTELDITAFSITQTWQGYFGNVSGTIQLTDADDNVMYNWSLANPEGEVYATELTTVDWDGITCFDLSAEHATLEAYFNITSNDVDGVNETFSDANTHDLFYTNNVEFVAGECSATYIYDDTGSGDSTKFQEVLMTDGTSNETIIYAAIIEESSVVGFDNRDHDFQMLVLEDGHGTDTATRDYYFYVELE